MSKRRDREPSPSTDKPIPPGDTEYESILWLVTRSFWGGFGPVALILLLIGTAQDSGWFAARDVAYFVVLGLIPIVRWIEYRSGKARIGEGKPATLADLGKYTLVLFSVALIAWGVAKVVGIFLLAR